MCTKYEVKSRKNEGGATISMAKKLPWCNNVQLNKVHLLIREVVWQTSKSKVLKVSSGTRQQSVEVLSKSVTFMDFRLSQGSVATYCRWGGNICDIYIYNFLTNHLVKEFWKWSTIAKVIIKHQVAYFFGTRCIIGFALKGPPKCGFGGDFGGRGEDIWWESTSILRIARFQTSLVQIWRAVQLHSVWI